MRSLISASRSKWDVSNILKIGLCCQHLTDVVSDPTHFAAGINVHNDRECERVTLQ